MAFEAHRISIDPADGSPPDPPAAPEAGLVLAYVPDRGAPACGRHLLEFAHRWREQGHRVVLADGCVDRPILHVAAGVENGEGLTDVVLHGTSLARVRVPLDRGVALVTAGTVVPDRDRVLEHPRWTTLVTGLREVSGLLVVAVADDAEAHRLEGLAEVVVRFDAGEEPAQADSAPAGSGRPAPDVAGSAPVAGPVPPTADALSRRSAASATDTARKATAPAKSGSRTGLLVVVLLLVVLGALGSAFMGWIEIPGVTPADVEAIVGSFPLR